MPRPNVDAENRDRLAEFVDRNADVPASVLTFDQQLAYVLDAFEENEGQLQRLQNSSSSPLR